MSKIRIFLSSSMTGELDDERNSIIQLFFEDEKIQHFYDLYSIDKNASPKEIEEAFLSEVEKADILICLFKKDLRIPVKKEYEKARSEGKKIFIYLYRDSSLQTDDLKNFVINEIYKYDPGFFDSTYRLLENIKKDIQEDIISTYRASIGIKNPENEVFRADVSTGFSYYRYYDPKTIENNKSKFRDFDIDKFLIVIEDIKGRNGDYKTALIISEIGLYYYPNDWKLYNNRGLILEEMGLIEYAFLSYKKALEFNNDDETLLYNIGNYYYNKRNYKSSIEYYLKSLKKNNKKINALNKLSLSYRGLGDFEKSLEFSKKTFEINNSEMYAINYAIILADNNLTDEANKIIETFLETGEKKYLNTKAYIFWKQKDSKSIIALFNNGNEIDNREIALVLIESYLIENNIDDAINVIMIIDKNLVYTEYDYNNIGFLLGKYNYYEQANEYLKKAISINPTFVDPKISLVANYANTKAYDEALSECNNALEDFPFEPKLIRNKYLILINQGRFKESISFIFSKTFSVTGLEDQIPKEFHNILMKNIEEL